LDQVIQCIDTLKTVLDTVSSSFEKAYSIILYIKDISFLKLIEGIFEDYSFDQPDLSQQIIQVSKLNHDYDLEISCSANLS